MAAFVRKSLVAFFYTYSEFTPVPSAPVSFVPGGWKRQVKARDGGVDSAGFRLSPLGLDHINILGHYAFILPDGTARSELRLLPDPAAASHDEG